MTTTPTIAPMTDPTPEEERDLLDRLGRVRTGMIEWVPFFGYLALQLEVRVAKAKHRIPTAAVTPDGIMYMNHHFAATLTDGELGFVVCHEVCHPALLYFERSRTLDAVIITPQGPMKLANLAHDFRDV